MKNWHVDQLENDKHSLGINNCGSCNARIYIEVNFLRTKYRLKCPLTCINDYECIGKNLDFVIKRWNSIQWEALLSRYINLSQAKKDFNDKQESRPHYVILIENVPIADRNNINKIFALCQCKFAFPLNSEWGKNILRENICPMCECYLETKTAKNIEFASGIGTVDIENHKHFIECYGHYTFATDGIGRNCFIFEKIDKEIILNKDNNG